jgi:hypothetical protein
MYWLAPATARPMSPAAIAAASTATTSWYWRDLNIEVDGSGAVRRSRTAQPSGLGDQLAPPALDWLHSRGRQLHPGRRAPATRDGRRHQVTVCHLALEVLDAERDDVSRGAVPVSSAHMSPLTRARVRELPAEFGITRTAVMQELKEMGEFARSASSTVEAPVAQAFREYVARQQEVRYWSERQLALTGSPSVR